MRRSGTALALTVLTLVGLVATFTYTAPESRAAESRTVQFAGLTWGQSLVGRVGSKSQAWNRKQNLWTAGGDVFVRTARYCTAGGARPGATAKAHPAPCGDIARTTYATGRIQVGGISLKHDFSVSFTADLPSGTSLGSRMALWMVHGPYCDADPASAEPTANAQFGELDVLEWYGRKPGKSFSTTHLACDATRTPQFLSDANKKDLANRAGTHTWKVVRAGAVLAYYRDGNLLGAKHVCGAGALTSTQTPPTCGAALRGPWTLIIQSEVFANECGANCGILTGPNDFDRFDTQLMRVRNLVVKGRA